MPVSGLPNPAIHRLCRRCGKWHHVHEGSFEFATSAGPFSWIVNAYRRTADPDAAQIFICTACTRPARSPWWVQALMTLAILILAAAGTWWLYSSGLIDSLLQGMGH